MVERGNSYILRVGSLENFLWKRGKPALSYLDMELTERCNNNCIHCCISLPAGDPVAKKKELPTSMAKAILAEAASLGCLTVRFTGGEPLLREDFEDLYLFARKKGLTVLLFTNATLLTPALAHLLSRTPSLEKIEITLYGMKRRSYEAVTRTPGSFEAAWRGIHLLLERKVPFVVKSALLPPNKEETEEFETWAATIPRMDNFPSYSIFFDLHSRRNEKRNREIQKLRPAPQEGVRFLAQRSWRYSEEIKALCSRFIGPAGDRLFTCNAGLGGGCVDAYGLLQPCMDLRHPQTAFDLTKGSLKDAMARFFPEVRKMSAAHPDYLARCSRCFLKGLCEQCPGKSWSEHGTLDTPVEYLCSIAHEEARYLWLLKKDEKAWKVEEWKERTKILSSRQAGKRQERKTSWK